MRIAENGRIREEDLLDYLKKTDIERYRALIEKIMEIRK